MPIYEYECGKCQKVHELTQKMSDPPLATCPECGGSVRKLISLSSFAFKGTGFYTTDYKRKTAPESSPPSASSSSNSPGNSSGSSSSSSPDAPKSSTTKTEAAS